MGEQGEMLKHHAHAIATSIAKRFGIHPGDLIVVDPDTPGGGLNESVDAPDKR
jgi:hypothetical protein